MEKERPKDRMNFFFRGIKLGSDSCCKQNFWQNAVVMTLNLLMPPYVHAHVLG